MSDGQTNDSALLQQYREAVLAYETIREQIVALLEANDGGTQQMSDEEYMRYREMARRRDALYDQMKHLEVQLLGDDAL